VLDASLLRQQRPLHLLPNRDRLPALRQLMLRMGAVLNEQLEARGLISGISTKTHHMKGVEGRATRHPFASAATSRTKSTLARRQSSSGGRAQLPDVPVAALIDDLRRLWEFIDTTNINTRTRYTLSAANVWGDMLSRETSMDDRQPNPRIFTYLDSQWGPLHRQICYARQHATSSLQCPLARPNLR
jgi:hypothetical protein